ncbi:MAG: helix-turn-helix domain-containing protein [Actinomycetota bacterium]|nr:helix-turn-helix domain-containing protein [Actinomycetota bacterium]
MRAYAHPLRTQILALLENRVASPKEIAAELGTPLTNTSYHVRQLVSLGFLELVRRTPRRGAIEHYYTAKVRPTIPDDVWAQLPAIVKRASAGSWVHQTIREIVAAVEDGGFDRADAHMTRTAGPLDEEGWDAVGKELMRALRGIDKAVEESRARLAAQPDRKAPDCTIVLMQFVGPEPKAVSQEVPHSNRQPSEADLALDETAP